MVRIQRVVMLRPAWLGFVLVIRDPNSIVPEKVDFTSLLRVTKTSLYKMTIICFSNILNYQTDMLIDIYDEASRNRSFSNLVMIDTRDK